ncbi:hypothetical protein [Aquimarina macrocephali]|uniref:hypothetical protein n=1 Tax=Aquimarina macrocephali TaxID=666563 RepID=UPI003F665400
MNFDQRINRIVDRINSNGITAYEISQNTTLTINGIQKIIDGNTSKPRSRTLDEIEAYLDKKLSVAVEGSEIEHGKNVPMFYNKNGSAATMKDISEYVVRNVDKFKEDIAFKNMIDKEALMILLKAKKGDTIDIDLIGK